MGIEIFSVNNGLEEDVLIFRYFQLAGLNESWPPREKGTGRVGRAGKWRAGRVLDASSAVSGRVLAARRFGAGESLGMREPELAHNCQEGRRE